jgi:hypothetical protein
MAKVIDPEELGATAATTPNAPEGTSAYDVSLITDLSQIPSVFSLEAQIEWLVEDMIAQGSITLICAESGTGKTWLAYYIAGCVAHGSPILGRPVRRCKALYLDGENPLCLAKQRLRDLGILETANLTVWGGWASSPPVGPDHPLVIDFARQHRGLIVYDSLIEFHSGSEQSSTETRAFMRRFRTLANHGASVLILHHTGKSETSKLYRGSSDIKAAVDMAYVLTRETQQPDQLARLSMECFKARLAPGRNFGMEFQKRRGFISCKLPEHAETATGIIAAILAENPNSNQREIVRIGQSRGCGKGQMEHLLRTGNWQRSSGPNNSILYSLPPEDAAQEEEE